MLTIGSQPKRRVSFLVLDVHIGASTKEEFYKLEVALVSGNGKSCVPGARHRGRINICPLHVRRNAQRLIKHYHSNTHNVHTGCLHRSVSVVVAMATVNACTIDGCHGNIG